jgi:sarcosine oxidase
VSGFDVIVVGAAGGAGSAAAYHLARRGARVLGLDRFPPGHDRGSSHGETRVIRLAYFEHPDYVPLLKRAFALWRELGERSGRPLLHEIGVVEIGPPDGEVVRGVVESARLHDLDIAVLTPRETMERFPGLHVPEGLAAAYEREAGYLEVEACVVEHARLASEAGAELRIGEEMVSWERAGDGVRVRTNRGAYDAGRLVLAPGAWAPAALADLSVRFETVAKILYWYEAPLASHSARGGCPVFLYELPQGVFYGIPRVSDRGMKVAEHTGGRVVADPLVDDRRPDEAEEARVGAFVARHLPGAGPRVLGRVTCFYPMSPDAHFLVGLHPRHAGVSFAAGLSGHGFKFTSVLGEILADLAIDGTTRAPIGFLTAERASIHS